MPTIAIVNRSAHADLPRVLPDIVRAMGKQLARDLSPVWGRPVPSLELTDLPSLSAAQIVILDDPDQADALGYHSETPEGLEYGRVFVEPILSHGGSLSKGPNAVSVTLSHELLEMIGDPGVNLWADADDGYSYAIELCDACQAASYEIDGVSVADFVYPTFFDPEPILDRTRRYDHLGLVSRPFETLDGGYQIRRTIGVGRIEHVYAGSMSPWLRTAKRHPAARSHKRMLAHPPSEVAT